jgi:hypothetical protein
LRRADLAAVLVGVAAIGYTVFAFSQSSGQPDGGLGASRPASASTTISTVAAAGTGRSGGQGGSGSGATSVDPADDLGPDPGLMLAHPDLAGGDVAPPAPAVAGDTAAGRGDQHGRAAGRGLPRPAPGGDGPHGSGADQSGAEGSGSSGSSDPPSGSGGGSSGSRSGSSSGTKTGSSSGSENGGSGSGSSTGGKSGGSSGGSGTGGTSRTTPPKAPAPAPEPTVACSRFSLLSTRVTFQNTSSKPLQVQWSSFGCRRSTRATVPPGGQVTLPTWVGHSWAFVDSSGRVVGTAVIQFGQHKVRMT